MGRGSSKVGGGKRQYGAFRPTSAQREWEERYRDAPIEHGVYFDGNGNVMLEAVGTRDYVEFDSHEMNHQVEMRIWDGEDVNFTHNHPENTIFSPDDVEVFEYLENHSEAAVLPNGTTYRLIRNQPRASNVWVDDPVTGEWVREFEPKHIAQAYKDEYVRIVNSTTREQRRGNDFWENNLTPHMANWLRQNASNYGYIFVEERG